MHVWHLGHACPSQGEDPSSVDLPEESSSQKGFVLDPDQGSEAGGCPDPVLWGTSPVLFSESKKKNAFTKENGSPGEHVDDL